MIHVDVTVDDFTTNEEIDALRSAFERLNIDATISATFVNHYYLPPAASGLWEAAWVVIIGVPVVEFLKTLGAEGAKALVNELSTRRKANRDSLPSFVDPEHGGYSGVIFLRDTSSTVRIPVGRYARESAHEIPTEAFKAITRIDFEKIKHASLIVWDDELKRWSAFHAMDPENIYRDDADC